MQKQLEHVKTKTTLHLLVKNINNQENSQEKEKKYTNVPAAALKKQSK